MSISSRKRKQSHYNYFYLKLNHTEIILHDIGLFQNRIFSIIMQQFENLKKMNIFVKNRYLKWEYLPKNEAESL